MAEAFVEATRERSEDSGRETSAIRWDFLELAHQLNHVHTAAADRDGASVTFSKMGKRAASSSKVNRKQRREEKAEVKEEDDEIQEVSMQVVLAKQVPVKDEGRRKRAKAKRSGTRPKVPRLRKPKLPQFAFEWFRQKTKVVVDGEERPEKPLPQLVMEWKNLTEEERGHYITLAEEDRLRFEREYEEWRQKKAAHGKAEPALQDLLEKRRATLQRYLARAEGLDAPKPRARKAKEDDPARSRKRNFRPPEGFPKRPVKSAYGLFCSEHRGEITAEDPEAETAEAQPKEGEGADPADAKVDRPGVSKLLALRKAWSKLPDEEKKDYVVRAAEDQERFRKELEVWRQDPANQDMANHDFVLEEAKLTTPRSRKLPRPRIRRSELIARPTRPVTDNAEIMYDILTGTQILAAQERKAEERAAKAARAEELEGGAFAESLDRPDSRAVQDFEEAHGDHVDTSVDDLLGDLLAVEAEPADEGDNGDIFGNVFEELLIQCSLSLMDRAFPPSRLSQHHTVCLKTHPCFLKSSTWLPADCSVTHLFKSEYIGSIGERHFGKMCARSRPSGVEKGTSPKAIDTKVLESELQKLLACSSHLQVHATAGLKLLHRRKKRAGNVPPTPTPLPLPKEVKEVHQDEELNHANAWKRQISAPEKLTLAEACAKADEAAAKAKDSSDNEERPMMRCESPSPLSLPKEVKEVHQDRDGHGLDAETAGLVFSKDFTDTCPSFKIEVGQTMKVPPAIHHRPEDEELNQSNAWKRQISAPVKLTLAEACAKADQAAAKAKGYSDNEAMMPCTFRCWLVVKIFPREISGEFSYDYV
eukprot:s661_g19.t3